MMKIFKVKMFAAALFASAASLGQAQVIYSDDFTSAPVVKSTTNANTNYAGNGTSSDLNQNEWMVRSGNGSVTHDGGKLDITIKNNIYYLIDLSTLENDPGEETAFSLSFDVVDLSGDVGVFAFAGGGLAYNGNSDGRIFYRVHGNPPLFTVDNGASKTQVIDGTTTTITSSGRFSTTVTLNDVGSAGDYLMLGFTNSGKSLTIDNLSVEVPSEFPDVAVELIDGVAVEGTGDSATIRISREGRVDGDLNVFYTISGSADSDDYVETYTGMSTIADGDFSVDLVFTPEDDAVFEGYENIQIELSSDPSYHLGSSTLSSITITEANYVGGTLALTVEPDGAVSLTRSDTGATVSNLNSGGWSIYNWFEDTRIALDTVTTVSANELLLQSADGQYQVNVQISGYDRYLKFELINVSNTYGGALDDEWPGHRVEFDLRTDAQNDDWRLKTMLLNPMSELAVRTPYFIGNGAHFRWPYPQWAQTTDRPQAQGAIAVYGFIGDDDHDDILTDIWVAEDSLPRPNRANQPTWTRADVEAWLNRWEAEQGHAKRQLSIDPKGNYDNLMAMTHLAGQAGMNHIYLSQHSWQGDNIRDFSSSTFPQGFTDAEAWRAVCDAYGIGISLHGFSHLIRKADEIYGRGGVSDDLARSAGGTLLQDVPAEAMGETFLVDPDWDYVLGMKEGMLPFYDINSLPNPQDFNGGLGGTYAPYYENMKVVINLNKNLYQCTVSLTADNKWQVTLDNKSGARVSTTPLVEHSAGDAVDFVLMNAGGGYFLPDSRSDLLVDQAMGYAALLNVVQTSAGYDGSAWTEDFGSWGLRRFSQEVAERMDHPASGGSAFGIHFFGHFEYQFKRVQALYGSVTNIPVQLGESSHLSSSLDDAYRAASQSANQRHLGLRSTHSGLTLDTIANHGHWDDFGAVLELWSSLKPYLSTEQADLIANADESYYVVSEAEGHWQLTQTQAMRRLGIDAAWNVQAERPAIASRQFFKADGESLDGLNNPYAEQVPVVQLHVMAGMSDADPANISLMPSSAEAIINPDGAEQTLGFSNESLIVSYDNTSSGEDYIYYTKKDTVGHWLASSVVGSTTVDMSDSRGLAITVSATADSLGSTLVVNTGGNAFPRYYVVDIDFTGEKTIEIPHGEVANHREGFDIFKSGSISQYDYANSVKSFRAFMHKVPAGQNASVEIVNIETLYEDRATGLIDPVLTLNGDSVAITGTIPYDHYLVYSGGSNVEVYGPNWNFVENLPVVGTGLTAGNGSNSFHVSSESANTHLSCRIKVRDMSSLIGVSKPSNEAPTLSEIADQTIDEDSSATVTFEVSDAETPVESLVVSAVSSDMLVPQAGLVLNGNGTNRYTLTVTPAAEQSGSTTITVMVSDGSRRTSESFDLVVNELVPDIVLSPASIDLTGTVGNVARQNLVLNNSGGDSLSWSAALSVHEGGYAVQEVPYNWVDISQSGTYVSLGDDQVKGPYKLGFEYEFYGQTFDQVHLCSNGFLNFSDTNELDLSITHLNRELPGDNAPANLLALFWDDLNPPMGSGRIYYQRLDEETFVVQYQDIRRYGSSDSVTAQVIIKSTGSILYQYKKVDDASSCTVGIQNADGTEGLSYSFNESGKIDAGLALEFIAPEPLWASLSKQAGIIAPGDSETIVVSADASDLEPGDYPFYVTVSSNDPDEANVGWPSVFTVLPQNALVTSQGTDFSWLDDHSLVVGGDYEAADLRDTDQDGKLNWMEFRDGTDPTDANSLLRITDLSINGNQLTLTWQAVAGKTYTLWFTPDFADQAWIPKRTGLVGTEPSSSEKIEISEDTGFYTLEVEP